MTNASFLSQVVNNFRDPIEFKAEKDPGDKTDMVTLESWLFHHRTLLDSEEQDEVDDPEHPDDGEEDQEAVPEVLSLVLPGLVLTLHLKCRALIGCH